MSWLSKITGIHLPGSGKKTLEGGIMGGIVSGLESTGKILTFQHTTRKDWLKTGALVATAAGGYYAYGALSAPSALAPTSAISVVEPFAATGVELEAASGAGMGLWAEPVFAASDVGIVTAVPSSIATGMELETAAGSMVAWAEPGVSSGIFSTIGSGLKTTAETLGLAGLLKASIGGVSGATKNGLSALIERETSSVFGGSSGAGGAGGTAGESGAGISGGLSMLPVFLIVLTLLGAFVMTRKTRGRKA